MKNKEKTKPNWILRIALGYLGIMVLSFIAGLYYEPLFTLSMIMLAILILLVVIWLTAEGIL